MKTLIAIALLAAASVVGASESFQGAAQQAAPAHPAFYSFADVYRLTVSGAAPSSLPLVAEGDSPMRVAVTQAAPASELQFSVVAVPEPERWLLLLSGLALAAWVARRRLGYFF